MRQKRNSQKKREFLFFFENRQCEQQKVTRSTAPVVPRGLRKASIVNFTIRIDNTCSNRSREAPRQWCRVGCEKRVLSILLSESTMRAAKGHAKHRASGAAWVAKSEYCQFHYQNRQYLQQQVT
ncbi:MAG: hypothetical protein IKL54_01605, partial [Bacteroidaceae bacterium]|nr:hypothetical protein [Bacteroidaceae bacterium]